MDRHNVYSLSGGELAVLLVLLSHQNGHSLISNTLLNDWS